MSNTGLPTGFNKKLIFGIGAGAAAVAIVVSVLVFMPSEITQTNEIPDKLTSSDVDVTPQSENPIVAEINDEVIRLEKVEDTVQTYLSQGQRLDKSAALDRIIVETLLIDEAESRDISVTLDEATEQLTNTYQQSGLTKQQFEQRLEQLGTTYEKTLDMYRSQLIINELLTQELSDAQITVTDEEAKTFYDQNLDVIKSQMGNTTVFEDVSPQIKSTIERQKQQKLVSDFIEELRDDAMILTYKDRL